MSIWEKLGFSTPKRKPVQEAPPVIDSPWGPVTDSARLQAALNMRADMAVRLRVQDKMISDCGGDVQRGLAEFRRRYPEVYLDDAELEP